MINRQKVYNRVRKHLLKQMTPAMVGYICQYRTYDPNAKRVLKCAVGCLIPFRHYTPDIEGSTIDYDSKVQTVLKLSLPGLSSADVPFLMELQNIHDEFAPSLWEERLNEFAEKHGLKVEA